MSLYDKLNKPAKANTASTSTNGTTSDATNSGNGTSQVTGIIGNALDFQSGRYTIAKESTNFGTEWSFNFWVNPQSADGNDYFLHHESSSHQPSSFYMYNSDDDPTGSGGVMVNVRDSTNTRLTLDASNNHIVFDINSLAGTWVMCTVTWNNSDKKIRLYQNGTLHAISKAWTHTSAGNMAVSGADWTMANYQTQTGSQYSARSKFDEWSFWKCTLSDAEIAELYNSGSGMKANGLSTSNSDKLMIYYNFEQGANNTITNQAGVAGTVFKLQRQRLVETFSADALDTDRWILLKDGYNNGVPTAFMSDEIDGGLKVTAQASINNSSGGLGSASSWAGNNIRQFAHNSSVYIDVFKQNTASSHHKVCTHGFGETLRGDGAGNNASLWLNGVNAGTSYFTTRTCNGSGNQSGNVSSDVAYDQNWHNYKIENKLASVEFILEGVLKTTITTNIPQGKMAPISGIQGTSTSTAPSYSIKYVECYNT